MFIRFELNMQAGTGGNQCNIPNYEVYIPFREIYEKDTTVFGGE